MTRIGERLRSAVLWNTGFSLFRDALQFTTMVVLVRILSADTYGEFGLVTSIIGWLTVFSFRTFVSHALQPARDEDVDWSLHFRFGIALNIGVFAAANLSALALRHWPPYGPIAAPLHVMSVIFLLDVPSELRVKMLERDLDWRRLRLLHAVGLIANAVLSVVLAAAGFGVHALLLPTLFVEMPFIWDLFVAQRWRPSGGWSRQRFAATWRFGIARLLSGALGNGRLLLQAGFLVQLSGYGSLGFFGRATGITQLLAFRFAFLLLQSIYPMLTRLAPGSATQTRGAALVLRTVGWICVPVGVAVAWLAQPLVHVVYGDRWLEVIPLLPYGALSAVAGALGHAAYTLLLANQGQARCLAVDLFTLVGTAAALFGLAPLGLAAYLVGLAAVQAAALAMTLRWLERDHAVDRAGVVAALLPPLLGGGLAWGLCEGARRWSDIALDGFAPAALFGLAFAALYLLILRAFFAPRLAELVSYLPARGTVERLLLLPAGRESYG